LPIATFIKRISDWLVPKQSIQLLHVTLVRTANGFPSKHLFYLHVAMYEVKYIWTGHDTQVTWYSFFLPWLFFSLSLNFVQNINISCRLLDMLKFVKFNLSRLFYMFRKWCMILSLGPKQKAKEWELAPNVNKNNPI